MSCSSCVCGTCVEVKMWRTWNKFRCPLVTMGAAAWAVSPAGGSPVFCMRQQPQPPQRPSCPPVLANATISPTYLSAFRWPVKLADAIVEKVGVAKLQESLLVKGRTTTSFFTGAATLETGFGYMPSAFARHGILLQWRSLSMCDKLLVTLRLAQYFKSLLMFWIIKVAQKHMCWCLFSNQSRTAITAASSSSSGTFQGCMCLIISWTSQLEPMLPSLTTTTMRKKSDF